jgi:hypothetical protein
MTEGLLRYRPASGSDPAMVLRIHQSVVRDETDNRLLCGRVEGWITLVGVERPVTLELTGNCLRDLSVSQPSTEPNTSSSLSANECAPASGQGR